MTIYRQRVGLPVSFELGVDGASVAYSSINQIGMELSPGKHDLLRLTHVGLHPRAVTDYVGKPLRMDLNTGPGYDQTFVGSIVAVKPVNELLGGLVDNSPFQTAELICLGASYDMRGKKSQNWSGHKLSDVAVVLAKRYGMSVDVPNDSLIISNIIQANESDWQFLVRYAGLLGYVVTCHGTHLHIFDPHRARDRQISLHTLITGKMMEGAPVPGIVTKFEGDFAERHADGEYMDDVITVSNTDGSTFDVRTSDVLNKPAPARFQNRLPEDVASYAEAVRLIRQAGHEHYDYYAEVKATGMLGCLPGGLAQVNEYKGEFDGWWYVDSVKHLINSNMFQTELCIARNKNTQLDTGQGVARFQTPPAPAFVNHQFRSARAVYNVY